jgi:SlyX protein
MPPARGLQIVASRLSVGTQAGGISDMEDEKLIDIESKLAHQEHTIAELNDALTAQQTQITNLDAQVRGLMDRVRAMSEAMPADQSQDERPPHY